MAERHGSPATRGTGWNVSERASTPATQARCPVPFSEHPSRTSTGMATAPSDGMTVAVPVWQDRVSPVFDTACRLLVVRRQRGREVERKEFILGLLAVEALARSVSELHVDVLLCAAISEPLRQALERSGVRVEHHLCGEVETLLAAFCAGNCRRSEFRMPGCWEQHEQGVTKHHNTRMRMVGRNCHPQDCKRRDGRKP